MPINTIAKEELERIIKEIPPEKKGVLNTSLSLEGVRAEVSWFIKPNWSLSAYGETTWKRDSKNAGVLFKGSW